MLLVPVQSVACALGEGGGGGSTQLTWQAGQVGTKIAPGTRYSHLVDMLKKTKSRAGAGGKAASVGQFVLWLLLSG